MVAAAVAGGRQRGRVLVMATWVLNERQRHPLAEGSTWNRQWMLHSVRPSISSLPFHGRDWLIDWRISTSVAPVTA